MHITYHGYTCFKMQSVSKATIITDIFDKSIGIKPPHPKADILTYSCAHYDSNRPLKSKSVEHDSFIINRPGEYEISSIMINGITASHGGQLEKESFDTTIYVFYIDGIKICHLGDLGQKEMNERQLSALGEIDVLMVPVGGNYVADHKDAARIVHQIEPRIIIPMAYNIKNLKIKFDKIDLFFKEIGLDPKEKVEKLKLTQQTLPQEEMELILMQAQ